MEHRLIRGGGQFLPFARSCITKLKRLGLPYADQSYEVDGVSVKVRIEPGHEYIRIEDGGMLAMDSGIVDLVSVGVNMPERHARGVLHETDYVRKYNLPFTDVSGGTRRNPSPGNVGQLSGKITALPVLRGSIDSQTLSFRPKKVITSSGDIALDEHDDALFTKKLVAWHCPPSIFTGRCRLYVQAMMGRPLGNGLSWPTLTYDTPSVPPALSIPSYPREGIDPTAVRLTTSSGVYLDRDTGAHWLFLLGGESMIVYPLISSAVGEALRRYLITGNPRVSNPLGDEDREHLEAYILAYCRPDVPNSVAASGASGGVGPYSMGYGWHWNWSGTQASIVHNYDVTKTVQGSVHPVMRSYRYEINVTRIERTVDGVTSRTWDAPAVTVEGPKDWAVPRAFWCIAEPNWGAMGMTKSTPAHNTPLFEADAPFYVYYQGDTLQVCRIMVSLRAADPGERKTSDALHFAGEGYATAAPMYTVGTRGGWYSDKVGYIDYFECRISIGGSQISELYLGRSYNEVKQTHTSKSLGYTQPPEDQFKSPPEQMRGFFVGYPDDNGNYTVGATVSSWGVSGVPTEVQFDTLSDQTGGNYSSLAVVATPLYDSEAVFTYVWKKHNRETVRVTTPVKAGGYALTTTSFYSIDHSPSPPTYHYGDSYLTYHYAGPNIVTLEPTGPAVETVIDESAVLLDKASLVCRAGVIETPKAGVMRMLEDATNDEVDITLAAYSNASSYGKTAVSPSLAVSGTDYSNSPFVFVGWA